MIKIESLCSDVVLKELQLATVPHGLDIELPEPVDGKTKLHVQDALMKHIIKRTSRMKKH